MNQREMESTQNPKLCFHGDLTLQDFWLEWFGIFSGRELGSNIPHSLGTCPENYEESHRRFTDNPETYLKFINWCINNKTACWITTQPMKKYGTPLGIEKLFFDFDYPLSENESMTPQKKRKVRANVLSFIEKLDIVEPLLIETNKGYHVYVFLKQVQEFEPRRLEFAKELYEVLELSLLNIKKIKDRLKWKYLDFSSIGDIMRMSRVPLTPHEKTGIPCMVLDRNLKETKIRSLDFYKTYGLGEEAIQKAVDKVIKFHTQKTGKELHKVNMETQCFRRNENGFNGEMRPCFIERLKIGEMKHQQRLALLLEMWWSGRQTKDTMLEVCKQFKDYDEKKSMAAINDFFSHNRWKYLPYRCTTLKYYGLCLQNGCPIYLKRKKAGKIK